ncbi:MAG TPA: helix-turn-helix domain-containing protein [Tepidisphaeraceae bacterium]|nr:helix-turn-helix domain-containing protein [Tepidisphaeraceae bacterium]
MVAVKKTEPVPTIRENEQKWGRKLMAAGWTAFPSVILERQQALGLDSVDVCILLHIARHWWYKDKLPFPEKKTIADCLGVHPRTVQRRIAAMERDGLIKRLTRKDPRYGQRSNYYDLSGLISAASEYADELRQTRAVVKAEKERRRTRKRLVGSPLRLAE